MDQYELIVSLTGGKSANLLLKQSPSPLIPFPKGRENESAQVERARRADVRVVLPSSCSPTLYTTPLWLCPL